MSNKVNSSKQRAITLTIIGLITLVLLAIGTIYSRQVISFIRQIDYVSLPSLNTTIVDSNGYVHKLDVNITLEVPKKYQKLIDGDKLITALEKACMSVIYEELNGTNGISLLTFMMEVELNKALPSGVGEQIKVYILELIIDDRLPNDKEENPNLQGEIFDGIFQGR